MKREEKVRLKDKRRRASYVSLGVYTFLVLAALAGVAYASRLPQVSVTTVHVVGASHVPVADVAAVVESKLSGTYGLLIPKRLAYVVPKGTLRASVIEAFPVIKSAEVTRTSLTEVTVSVTERDAHALWCSSTCFRLDEYGLLFSGAQPSDDLRKFYGGEYRVGMVFMDGAFHDFSRFIDDVEKITDTSIQSVRVQGTDGTLSLSSSGEVRIRMNADFEQLRTMLTAIYTSNEFKKQQKLDYIELRFGKKAVVKFI